MQQKPGGKDLGKMPPKILHQREAIWAPLSGSSHGILYLESPSTWLFLKARSQYPRMSATNCNFRQLLRGNDYSNIFYKRKLEEGLVGKIKWGQKIYIRRSMGSPFLTKMASVAPCYLVPWSFINKLFFPTSSQQWIWQWVGYTWNKTGHESISIEDGWWIFWGTLHYSL